MLLLDLVNVPVQVTSMPRQYVDSITVTNRTGDPVFVKLYDRLEAPDGNDVPEFSFEFADGVIDQIRVIAYEFVSGCYIAASTTEINLETVVDGLKVNIAGQVSSSPDA